MKKAHLIGSLAVGTVAAGAATIAYSATIGLHKWTLRTGTVPILAPDSEPLTILHLSDFHMLPHHRAKQEWIRGLADLEPDLVVLTGDNLAHPEAIPAVLSALEPLLEFPGVFVFGSNDYYGPRFKNPLKYFKVDHERVLGADLPWQQLRQSLLRAGWLDLNNRRENITIAGRLIECAGVDDSHIDRDDYDAIAGPVTPDSEIHLGLAHSPEPRVLDRFVADGFSLLFCGHTHGGQLCVPGYGALVTNCGIDRKRGRGLHHYAGDTWINVSAGLGTSPFFPIRFACPPEASLVTLVPASAE